MEHGSLRVGLARGAIAPAGSRFSRSTSKARLAKTAGQDSNLVNFGESRLRKLVGQASEVEPVLGKGGEITKRAVGEEWELRGVETGGFVGFSDKVWVELGQPPMQRPPRGFLTRFCYVKAKRMSGSKSIGNGKE